MPMKPHEFALGYALQNVLTNGRTTDASKFNAGDGLYPSRTHAKLVSVIKCVRCGHVVPPDSIIEPTPCTGGDAL